MHKKTLEKSGNSSRLRETGIKKPHQKKLSRLQQRMTKKLDSAKFRMLNESLYSVTGTKAKAMMDQSPQLFQLYHAGYAEQVKRWPKNPLDDIIKFLSTRKKSLRIADLGCGEARLSLEVPQQVKSFDLVAVNGNVTACDIARLPLADSSVDVAVFCLSLMGTNYGDFLREAYRILDPNGIVIIAEVASRFPNHDPKTFVQGVESIGFCLNPDHPLTTGPSARERSVLQKKGKGRKQTKSPTRILRGSKEETAFFIKFVFTSRKTSFNDKGHGSQKKKLPELGKCLYKKR